MKKTLSFATAALLLALTQAAVAADQSAPAAKAPAAAAPAAKAPAANGPVAKVNGTVIPASLSEWVINQQAAQGAPVNDDMRAKVRTHLIQREVLLQEARKSGIEKDAAVRQLLEFSHDDQLINAYLKDWVKKHPVSEAQMKAEYDKQIKAAGETEYKTRHILVEKEDDAKDIIKKLQGGAKFADLAKASKDPGSKDNGGDLGWSRPSSYVPEFAQALAKLQKGKYTTAPVKTQFGYHVILLEDSRKASNPKFADVKGQMSQGMQQEVVQKYIADLVSKAKVE